MRLYEITGLREDASGSVDTSSGSIATVAMPLGAVQRRVPGSLFSAKYTNDATPNTPAEYKRYKRKNNVN
jgi:hypothetical protein